MSVETHVPSTAPRITGGPTAFIAVQRAGIVTGLIFGGWHLIWAALIAGGWAQPVLDFAFWMHQIKPVFVVEPFNALRSVVLIVVTGLIGYVFGSVFAFLWNHLHR